VRSECKACIGELLLDHSLLIRKSNSSKEKSVDTGASSSRGKVLLVSLEELHDSVHHGRHVLVSSCNIRLSRVARPRSDVGENDSDWRLNHDSSAGIEISGSDAPFVAKPQYVKAVHLNDHRLALTLKKIKSASHPFLACAIKINS